MNSDERVLCATPLPSAVDAPLRAAIAAYHDAQHAGIVTLYITNAVR